MNRVLKRIFIGIILILMIAGVGYSISYLQQDKSTCNDGVENGKEEGIDCGALACGVECPPIFIPLDISSEQVIKVAEGDYDFVAKLYNPNPDHGTGEIVYDMVFYDKDGREIYRNEKTTYILPAQTKFIVESSIRANSEVSQADIEIKSVKWETLDLIGTVGFSVVNQDRTTIGGRSELYGIALNDSVFDLDRVDITIVMMDNAGKIVAVNKTNVRTLLAHTQRQFVANWPMALDFKNLNTTIEFGTNLFLNSNYIKQYGSPEEKFQQYY